MKILKFILEFVMAFALAGCTDSVALPIEREVEDSSESKSSFITESEAIKLANEVFSNSFTRGGSNCF